MFYVLFLLAPSAPEKKNQLKPDNSGSNFPHPILPRQKSNSPPLEGLPIKIPLSLGTESRPMPSVFPVRRGGGNVNFDLTGALHFDPRKKISNVWKAKSYAVISITKPHLTLVLVSTHKICRVKTSQKYHSNDRNKTKYFASEFIDL